MKDKEREGIKNSSERPLNNFRNHRLTIEIHLHFTQRKSIPS